MKKKLWIGIILAIGLLAVLLAGPVYGGATAQERGASGDVVPDSYIVVLQDGASADDVASAHGVARKHLYSSVFNGFSGKVPPGRVDALRNDPRVVSVSANHRVQADPESDAPGGNGKGGGNDKEGGGKNKPPKVTISSPSEGQVFSSGASIDFAGSASDNEDGDLTADLAWTSDGVSIGSGSSFSATLSDGDHTITATVTDSGDKSSTDSVSITVGSASDPAPPPSSQVVPSGVARIGADKVALTGTGVGVAIVDSGIDLNHPDLNVSGNCFTAYASCQDDAGHGTHVAGIVAALDNDSDVVGVAPGATLYAVKVLSSTGGGTWADVVAGLDWVLANQASIRVVNMSLGSKAFDGDDFIGIAIGRLHDAGISVVVSAGNAAGDEISDRVPARFADTMAIASTTAKDGSNTAKGPWGKIAPIAADTASYFTTDGAGVTVSAPGESHEDIVSGGFIQGTGILSLKLGGGTTRMSGTSMSAPHVAGVVALLVQEAGGTLAPEAARIALNSTAVRQGDAPLDSPAGGYSFDGTREGVLDAVAALAAP